MNNWDTFANFHPDKLLLFEAKSATKMNQFLLKKTCDFFLVLLNINLMILITLRIQWIA